MHTLTGRVSCAVVVAMWTGSIFSRRVGLLLIALGFLGYLTIFTLSLSKGDLFTAKWSAKYNQLLRIEEQLGASAIYGYKKVIRK